MIERVNPRRGRQRRDQRPADVARPQRRSDAAAQRDRGIDRLLFVGANSRYATIWSGRRERVQRRVPARAAQTSCLGRLHPRQTRRNIGETDTIQTLESWGAPITVTEVTSGEVVDVWRRGTANSARLFYNATEMNLDYHGGDITLNKRLSNRWALLAGASWGRVTSPTRGGLRSNPHILDYFDEETLADTDRPWSYRLSGLLPAALGRDGERDVAVSGWWAGGDDGRRDQPDHHAAAGQSDAPRPAVRKHPTGEGGRPRPDLPQVVPVGQQHIAPRLDIFNATNEATVTARRSARSLLSNLSGIRRGRLIKLGVNLDF